MAATVVQPLRLPFFCVTPQESNAHHPVAVDQLVVEDPDNEAGFHRCCVLAWLVISGACVLVDFSSARKVLQSCIRAM